jgi:hypothetical protein
VEGESESGFVSTHEIERQKHASILGRQAYLGFYVEGVSNVPKMFVMGQSSWLLLGKRKQP